MSQVMWSGLTRNSTVNRYISLGFLLKMQQANCAIMIVIYSRGLNFTSFLTLLFDCVIVFNLLACLIFVSLQFDLIH